MGIHKSGFYIVELLQGTESGAVSGRLAHGIDPVAVHHAPAFEHNWINSAGPQGDPSMVIECYGIKNVKVPAAMST